MLASYGFIILGLPNIIGLTLVSGLALLVLPVVPTHKRQALLAAVDVIGGLLSVCAGVLILGLLKVDPAIWFPIAAAIWFAIHFSRINKIPEFLRASLGIVGGWWIYEFWICV